MSEKFYRYHSAQRWLIKDSAVFKKDRLEMFKIICEHVSKVLNIDRVGVWLLSSTREFLVEELSCHGDEEFSSGRVISKKKYPKYFSTILADNLVVSQDVRKDSVLSELLEEYLAKYNIESMLDAPIYSDGQLVGILCLENSSRRIWDGEDLGFAAFCADFVARCLESESRKSHEKILENTISYLQSDLDQNLDELNDVKISLDYALEGAEIGKWSWNLVSGEIDLDKSWFQKFGYNIEELPRLGKDFLKYIHSEDSARVKVQLREHLEGKTEHYESRYRVLKYNGATQWVLTRGRVYKRDGQGNPLKMAGVNMNFSPSVQVEETLKHSERQLKSIVESLPIPVAMFDKELNYIAFSSIWKQEWSGYSDPKRGMVAGNKLKTVRPEWITVMKQALTGIILSSDGDLVDISPNKKMWVKWTIQPWKNSSGEINGVIVVAENITQKKETEIKLAQTSKLSALGEMAAGIAHEINNPLSIIKGYLDLLKRHSIRRTLNEEMLGQYIYKMDQTVGRISRIVSGMRRFSRESSLDEKVIYSLNKIISETLDICQERISNHGISISVEYFKQEAIVFCRPVELSQVLLNLINNSFQALVDKPRSWIKIECEETKDLYRVFIKDSGTGITKDIQSKLFQPFFTTKEVGVGTGLGLSISRGIMEEHKGQLFYESGCKNTTFVLEIPKATGMANN